MNKEEGEILVNKTPEVAAIHPKMRRNFNFFFLMFKAKSIQAITTPKTNNQKIILPLWLIQFVRKG